MEIYKYVFPEIDAPGRYLDAEALVKTNHGEYLVIGDIEVTAFSLAHQLVGMEKLLMDFKMETEYVFRSMRPVPNSKPKSDCG